MLKIKIIRKDNSRFQH